ncbi:unnamed protein product [Caenorhabditis angaria]|uniref:EGF-like domain-containing protein n=1 Tax=Caenorhabditis angaria TaxID=860376 RepID=A0A9P1N2Y8_9PELO|nr:unnamed protein product [Caenorhabditis angaria]
MLLSQQYAHQSLHSNNNCCNFFEFPTKNRILSSSMQNVEENDKKKIIEQLTDDENEYENPSVIDGFESSQESQFIQEEEEESQEVQYNLAATKSPTTSMSPEMERKMEQLMIEKCTNHCENNATCSLEMYYKSAEEGTIIIPICHCKAGWEGQQCERQYVQEFYAAISGNGQNVSSTHNRVAKTQNVKKPATETTNFFGDFSFLQNPSSAVPAVTFLILMLIMFVSIVLYAYKRMSRRIDETTYTMSHMCPPEAFTVLKTPCGRKISVHESLFSSSASSSGASGLGQANSGFGTRNARRLNSNSGPIMTSTPAVHLPQRTPAVRILEKPSIFQILRNQGSIPSRSINENDTPKYYKSVPRVEVSAINYSGHIDFSNILETPEESRPHRTSPPPHIVIQMDEESTRSTLDPTTSPIARL